MSFLNTIGEPPLIPPEWQLGQAQLNAMQAQAAQQTPQDFFDAQNYQLGQASAQNTLTPELDYHGRARKLFVDRMRGVRSEFKLKAGDFLHCHLHDDTVFVFFLFDGKEGVVKEQVDIFPSDQMITQFRMMV